MKKSNGKSLPEIILRYMRYTIAVFFLFSICAQLLWASASIGQSLKEVRIDISMNNKTLKESLTVIEQKSGFGFIYNEAWVLPYWVTVNEKNKDAAFILQKVLRNTKLDFKEYGNKVIIVQREQASPVQVNLIVKVQGIVKEKDTGEPLPGVSIRVKNSSAGTISDSDGKFGIDVTDENSILVFSFIGFLTVEQRVGSLDFISITMEQDITSLSEVVVTALGFKESADKLGSTSSKVNGEAIERSGETSVINALGGKASGVMITKSSGDPGAAAFIQIRGQNTITGNNQPLIIVDGIPISNATSYTDEEGTSGGVVPQSRLNDINPNDIASVQILKGASAAALWGSRAANGVILISTKKGAEADKVNISFSSTLSVDKINAFHPIQDKYGQGTGGNYNPSGSTSWGDKISNRAGGADDVNTSGRYFQAQDGTLYYPILTKNSQDVYVDSNYDKVFRTGQFLDNAISISGGDAKTVYYFSVGDLRQKGILRGNSEYTRTTVRLNTERTFNNVLRLGVNTAYTNSYSDRIQRGNNTAGAMVGLLRNPADFDKSDYKGSYFASATSSPITNRQRSYRSYLGALESPIYNNALWALNEEENSTLVNRFMGRVEIGVQPTGWLDITGRTGLDTYTDQQINYYPIHDLVGAGRGQYQEQMTKETELNADLIGRAQTKFGVDFAATFILGFNLNNRKYDKIGATINDFILDEAPANFSNAVSANRVPYNYKREIRTTRLYATAGLSAYESLFLNLSAAAESASSFGELSEKTFYYPSVDVAWQFSKLGIFEDFSTLTFGKLRASYGIVGVQPLPYRSNTVFTETTFSNTPWGDNVVGGSYGNGAYSQNKELGDPEIKPETKTEYEAGIDLRFLSSRLRFSTTYYQNKVKDLLVPVTIAPSTGFASKYTNAATLENKGLELDLSYDVIAKPNLTWTVYGNFSSNRNEVLDLAGTQSLYLTGIADFLDSRAVVGQPVGVFWSGRYAATAEGGMLLDANGFPTVDAVSGTIGDPNPDFMSGFGTTLSYKKITLDVLFETTQGGDYYSGTKGIMYNFGTHAETGNEVTLAQDLKNYAGATISTGSTVRGNITDFGGGPVLLDETWYTTLGSGFGSLKEQFIEDGSWTRLRQVTLSYRLDPEWFRKKTKLQSLELSFTGRNLIVWTDIEGIDPDTNLTGTFTGRNMDYFNSPNTRSYLCTLKINY